jgi:hypothetical protein
MQSLGLSPTSPTSSMIPKPVPLCITKLDECYRDCVQRPRSLRKRSVGLSVPSLTRCREALNFSLPILDVIHIKRANQKLFHIFRRYNEDAPRNTNPEVLQLLAKGSGRRVSGATSIGWSPRRTWTHRFGRGLS